MRVGLALNVATNNYLYSLIDPYNGLKEKKLTLTALNLTFGLFKNSLRELNSQTVSGKNVLFCVIPYRFFRNILALLLQSLNSPIIHAKKI